jgi:hypothetical protein
MRTTLKTLGWVVLGLLAAGCGDDATTEEAKTGTLKFLMNGEGFSRDGFVSEDGWRVDFDHVYVTVEGPTAFQVAVDLTETETDALSSALTRLDGDYEAPLLKHAGHPHAAIPEGSAHEALLGTYQRDVHQGPDLPEIGRAIEAPIGNYNYLNFDLVPATAQTDGLAAGTEGTSLLLVGKAVKDARTVTFTLRFTESFAWTSCGPHPDAPGVVAEGGTGQVELTFHLDHIFGDAGEGPADPTDEDTVNHGAIGFAPFLALAEGDVIDATQAALSALPEYERLLAALATLGHYGEGHCNLAE